MSEMNYFLMYLSVVLPSLLRSDLILKENFCFGVFLILFYYLNLEYCIGFAVYQHESATGIHVLPMFWSLILK